MVSSPLSDILSPQLSEPMKTETNLDQAVGKEKGGMDGQLGSVRNWDM